MQTEALRKFVLDIKNIKSESQTLKLKAATHGCPTRLFDTPSPFSDRDEGGIIFGVDEGDNYSVKGVYDAQNLRKKVTERCKQMEPSVCALFTIGGLPERRLYMLKFPALMFPSTLFSIKV